MSDNILGNESGKDTRNDSGSPVTIIAVAFILLCALSLIKWADLTKNTIKDFDIFADVVKVDSTIDPQEEYNATIGDVLSEVEEEVPENPASGYAGAPSSSNDSLLSSCTVGTDSASARSSQAFVTDIEDKVSTVNGHVVIEDYSADQSGMRRLSAALASHSTRPVRIAMMGDSYIEGDIITQDLRRLLQNAYGGRGVGYLAADSKVAGFRQTVRQQSKGWTEHPIKDASRSQYFTIAGDYYTGKAGATISLKGSKTNTLKSWRSSRIVFVAPTSGTITLTNDLGEQTFDVTASDAVQTLTLNGETTALDIKNNVDGLIFLGAWLEDDNGVVLDNMSIRGDSGIPRARASTSIAAQMRQYVDYDLIILEFGINALSPNQSDYTTYGKQMLKVIERIKECYPNADILVMGIGDRGQKVNGTPHSLSTAKNMVEAQRNAAKSAGVMFWDTRQAMGGEDAIVKWRESKLANADYIHLNHKGGAALADSLYGAIRQILK